MALLAAAGLTYEIALTRLLSALLVSSWVAPVLAVALLGVGLGAALAALSPALRSRVAAAVAAGSSAVLAVLSLPAWLWAAGRGEPLLGLLLPLLAYLASGLAVAAILSWTPPRAAWLLRADYGAAALAAAAAPWLMGRFGLGALGIAVVAAALAAAAGMLLAGSAARPARVQAGDPGSAASSTLGSTLASTPGNATGSATGSAASSATGSTLATAATTAGVAAVALAALALAVGSLEVDPGRQMRAKPISQALGLGGVATTTRWDATARTDLVRLPNGARYLYMDGGAGSLIPTPDPGAWSHDVGAFAFAMAPARSAFLIGSGGGLDVAQAREHDVDRVVAVEVNPASVALVRELGASTGSVYDDNTEVVIGDGRRVLAGGSESFDVITLANVVTGAAELRGAALTENRVYTVEAFTEYLQHLNPDGRLVLKLYDELTLTRALTTAIAALIEGGYAEDAQAASRHLLAVLGTSSSANVPVLVIKRSSFTGEQAVAAARVAERNAWALLLVPGLLAPPPLQALVDGDAGLEELVASSPDVDLAPTHDAAPYFFSFEPGVPDDVRRAGVLALLLVALAVVVAFILAAARPRELVGGAAGHLSSARTSRLLLASFALGSGFLLVELNALPLIQRSAGHPAWSLSLTLGAVLLGSAVGAQLATRATRSARATRASTLTAGSTAARAWARAPAIAAGLAVVAWSLLATPLAALLSGLDPLLSGLALGLTLFVASIPMGLPFPRILAAFRRSSAVALALAFSGVAAVAAGAGALWLAHAVGSPAVGWAAAFSYLIAGLLAGTVPAVHDSTAGSPPVPSGSDPHATSLSE